MDIIFSLRLCERKHIGFPEEFYVCDKDRQRGSIDHAMQEYRLDLMELFISEYGNEHQ